MTQLGPYVLIRNGMSSDIFAYVSMSTIPTYLFFGPIVSYLCKYNYETKMWVFSLLLYSANGVYMYVLNILHGNLTISNEYIGWFYLTQQQIEIIAYCFYEISIFSFIFKICDPTFEGTFIAIFTTAIYTGGFFPVSLCFYLIDFIDLTYLFCFGVAYNALFISYYGKDILDFANKNKEDFIEIQLISQFDH